MATLNKEDPLLNVTGLVKHIYQFKEDAYLALKMAITRLREPHRTRFVTDSLTQAMDFCTIHHLLSKLAPLDYRRLAATAKKHSLVFYGNDPMVDNFWQFPPDSFHYYYLKMLLCRLPEQIRFAISARLLMIILREIVSKPATDFLLPYDPEKCKWTTLDKANQSTSASFVTPTPVSPLLDPLKSDIFWNVVHPDNVYSLLKQFLARLGPPETRNAMCFKMLKSCIDYASDKDILAPYEPSKANHMPSGKSVPVAMTNGKTFILPSAKKEAETKNTQQNSSSPAEPSPEQKMVSDRPNLSSSSSFDESAAFVSAWMEKDCNVTSQGKLPDTAEIFRDIVWTRAVSELQLAENPNVPEDFDWASPPSEDDTSNDQACSAVDKSSSFDSTNFAWNRTPSYYYYRDSPLQLADVSGFSSSFDWTQPPSKAIDEAAGAANSASNGCTSSEQQPVDDGKHWLKTPTTVGAMPPRRLLSALEMIELPSEEAAVSRANTSCPATDLQSFGSIYSYIASAGSVRVRSCSSSSCLRASGAPVVFERLISTGTPPTASSPRADAATQTPPCPS